MTATLEPMPSALAAIEPLLNGSDSHRLIRAKVRALMAGYDARWRNSGYETLAVETTLTADLMNPDTNRKSRSLTIAGKLDAVALRSGRTALFDHKTTSQTIDDPNAPYWRQLVVEGQASHYLLLKWQNGEKVDDAVWDVCRKPSIQPRELTKSQRASIAASGTYYGTPVSMETREAVQAIERETFDLYEARLANDCTEIRPAWYFQRRSVPRMDNELLEYASELWEHGQELLHVRATDRWARNSGACMLYGTPCKFLGICSGHDTADSDKWQRKPQVHAELPELDGDGKDVLTNSRIRCFQTCRRKHYFEYELGIERQDEEEREALFFGSVWHTALNAWFNCFRKDQDHEYGNDTSRPASVVGGVGTSATDDAGGR